MKNVAGILALVPKFNAHRTTMEAASYYILTVSLNLVIPQKPAQGGVTHLKASEHKSKFLLTHREREVFELLVQDKTTRDIAQQLFISEKTVRNHISNVMQKLNVKGRSQAVVELIKLGELTI